MVKDLAMGLTSILLLMLTARAVPTQSLASPMLSQVEYKTRTQS